MVGEKTPCAVPSVYLIQGARRSWDGIRHPKASHSMFSYCCCWLANLEWSIHSLYGAIQVMFTVTGLQILRNTEEEEDNNTPTISSEEKEAIIDWIYTLQTPPRRKTTQDDDDDDDELFYCGFETGNSISHAHKNLMAAPSIASTFSALALLRALGDDLSRVDKQRVLNFVAECQNEDGSFSSFATPSEQDLRFTFSAVASCHILGDFSSIDVEKAEKHILQCQVRGSGFFCADFFACSLNRSA